MSARRSNGSGYANFVVENPPLKFIVIEGEGDPGTINHVGIEVTSTDEVSAEAMRSESLGLPVKVDGTHTCCDATQDKVCLDRLDRHPRPRRRSSTRAAFDRAYRLMPFLSWVPNLCLAELWLRRDVRPARLSLRRSTL